MAQGLELDDPYGPFQPELFYEAKCLVCAPVCGWDMPSIITLHIFSSVIYDSRMVSHPWKGLTCVILHLPSGYGLCTRLWTLVFFVAVECDKNLPRVDGS